MSDCSHINIKREHECCGGADEISRLTAEVAALKEQLEAEKERARNAWRDPETLDRCARAMFDAEIIDRTRNRLTAEGALHLLHGYTSESALDTVWASSGKDRGLWIDRARRVLSAALPKPPEQEGR